MNKNWKSCLFAMAALIAVATIHAQSSGTYTVHNLTVGGTATGSFGGGGSGTFQSLITDLKVSYTSGTRIDVAAGDCWESSKSAMNFQISGTSGNGSAEVYCTDQGEVVVEYTSTLGGTWTGSGLTPSPVGVPGVPAGARWLGTVTVTSGSFANSVVDKRSWSIKHRAVEGTGMSISCADDVCTYDVDTAVIQSKTDDYDITAGLDASAATSTKPIKTGTSDPGTCSVGEYLFRTDTGATKACTATNTWTAISGGSSVTKVTQTFQKSPVACDQGSGANYDREGDLQEEGGSAGAPTASCVGNVSGGLRFSNTTANPIVMSLQLPAAWSSGDGLALELLAWEGTGSGDVRFNAETKCVAAGEDMTGTSSYNSAQTSTTATFAGGNLMRSLTWSSLTTTGCAAGELLRVRITRDNTVGSNLAAAAQINHFILKYKVTLE